jgi:hypothetical protein
MAALTKSIDSPKKHRHYSFAYKVKGSAKGFSGGGGCVDANGFLVAASDTASLKTVGRLLSDFDTTATGVDGVLADGVLFKEAEHGVFAYATGGANPIVQASIGTIAEWLDDQTVSLAAGTANHVKAGRVLGIDPDTGKIWIDTLIQA